MAIIVHASVSGVVDYEMFSFIEKDDPSRFTLLSAELITTAVYLLVVRHFEADCKLYQLLLQFLYCHRTCLHFDNFRNGSLTLNFEFEVRIALEIC